MIIARRYFLREGINYSPTKTSPPSKPVFPQSLYAKPKMLHSEKLCLKWNDFQENLNSAFGGFRNDQEFSDVTLACEDGTQVETHKVILASSSPFFMEVLKRNKHQHPLIYMRGVKADEMVAMIDFLYYGEANVNQESLDAFLALAEELKLKGLTGSAEPNDGEEYLSKSEKKVTDEKQHKESILKKTDSKKNIYNPITNRETSSVTPNALVSTDVQQLDDEVKSMMDPTETIGSGSKRVWKCKVCGKEGQWGNIKTHIEANHISSNVSHACDICGKTSRSRNGLRQHKAKDHCT